MSASPAIVSVSCEAQVADTIAELSVAAFPRALRAILLTGSLARGEGTWLHEGARVRLAGDADFFVVFNERAALPSLHCVAQLQRGAEARLASAGIEVHLGVSAVRPGYFRRLRPNIFSYELIAHGKVVWGDANILKLAPACAVSEIPLDDGFRLLMNRMIELLETVCELDAVGTSASAVRYRAMKLWLDMATSYLLFERQYVPTYRGRAVRLRELAAGPSTLAPIPLRRFAQTVALATRCKLGESGDRETPEFSDLATLIDDAHSLWRWELERLTDTGAGASDDELVGRWLAKQTAAERIRGWASLAKRNGMLASFKSLPRWIRQAPKGSPRRLIYTSASEQFFALPVLLAGGERDDSVWRQQLDERLPLIRDPRALLSWRHAVQEIAWNYHQFLESTRA